MSERSYHGATSRSPDVRSDVKNIPVTTALITYYGY